MLVGSATFGSVKLSKTFSESGAGGQSAENLHLCLHGLGIVRFA